MKKKTIVCLILLTHFSIPLLIMSQNSLDKSAEILRKQIQEEKQRNQELKQQKEKLERMLNERKDNLQHYDNIIQNYEYNLNQTQNVIDAAQQEIQSIQNRRNKQEIMLYRCIFAYYQNLMKSTSSSFHSQIRKQVINKTVENLSNQLFQDMQTEKPRLLELKNLIQDRQSYQERILTKYMPTDLQRKEKQEAKLNEVADQAKETSLASAENQKRIKELNDQLAAAEKKIAEIRQQKLLEEKRKKEAAERERKRQERLAQEEKENRVRLSELPQPNQKTDKNNQQNQEISLEQLQIPKGTPFAQQKGKLNWPARGKIVRPYGEFTHPQFGITMKNHGLDIEVDSTQTVNAAADGQVLYIGEIPGIGNTLILNHGNDYMTIYGNIRVSSGVQTGTNIKTGQAIGYPKTSGANNFSQYHFEIRKGETSLNPNQWLQS